MHPSDRVGAGHLAGMVAVGLAMRVALAWGIGWREPFGEDAAFWGYEMLELARGRYVGDLPPVYAALGALLGGGVGATAVALAAGVAIAPLLALAAETVAGGRAGRTAGWLAVPMPAMWAWSIRVEPTTLVAACTALAALLAARTVRGAGNGTALAFGVVAGGLPLVKENGLPVGLVLVAVVARAAPGRAVAAVAGAAATYALWAGLDAMALHTGVRGKISMPVAESRTMLLTGRLANPLHADVDRFAQVSGRWLEQIARPDATPVSRAFWFAAVQAWRTVGFLGPWAVAIPAACVACVRAWRAGRLAGWQAALPVGLALTAAPFALIVFQSRHADVAALGGLLAVAVATAGRPWLARSAVAAAFAWGAVRIAGSEAPTADRMQVCAKQEAAIVDRVLAEAGEGGVLCAMERWVGFRAGVPASDCAEGETPRGAWIVASPRELAGTWTPKPGFVVKRRERAVCRGAVLIGRIEP
ncbi:MAG: hypothetical protein ACOZNI_26885 [Myxococcota bacterium]